MDRIVEAYNKKLNSLLGQRDKIDTAIGELNVQYAADIEQWVRSTEDPGDVDDPEVVEEK